MKAAKLLGRRTADWILLLVFLAAAAALFFGSMPLRVSLQSTLLPPSSTHWVGTDALGRDLFWRLLFSLQYAVAPIWAVTLAGILFGFALGLAKGKIPLRILSIVVTGMPLGVAVFTLAAVQNAASSTGSLIVFFIFFVAAGFLEARRLRDRSYQSGVWQAHEALGGSYLARVWRYGVLQEWRPAIIGFFIYSMSVALSAEVALSYLGFGVQEPLPSLGNILAAHMDQFTKGHTFVLLITVALFFFCLGLPGAVARIFDSFSR
jgi:ABC-type dipeptide/oligopeptide/nickel transport system permease subunit